ncbi:EthD family reductase [Alkalihalobacterium alkalinitrilicum]|uniref:EthD family reductase n=1 Tax=Alkalihalobacterium alkalinitrilicum TaxID=427920 RepID=UPI001303C871|nr:EthD family reductase [Alkalihalobacterium alkalinitrilicum]
MAKVIIMYEQPKDADGFESYYFGVHLPLAKKIPNIKNEAIHRVVRTQNTDLNLYLIVELEFESLEVLQQAMATPEADATVADLPNMNKYLHHSPIISIVE